MGMAQNRVSQLMNSEEEIRQRLSPLFNEPECRLAVLFGSAVSGNIHRRSDIDLAFLFDVPVDIIQLTNRVIQLLKTDRVDVVDLKRACPLLKYSAVNHGGLLYEREAGMFNEFVSFAVRLYIDTKKLREAQAISVKHFLREKGLS